MPTMTLSPDSANDERSSAANASPREVSAALDLAERKASLSAVPDYAPIGTRDMPDAVENVNGDPAMTEDDTVCVLEVLAEMQRIIDRHLEKTGQAQSDG